MIPTPPARRRALTAMLASLAGAVAASVPIVASSPSTAHATGSLQQIAFETNPSPGLVTLGDLASRSQRKPVTRAGLGPYTISGTDSLTGQPYSFVTDEPYDPSDEAAYAHEGDEGIVDGTFDVESETIAVDDVDPSRTNVLRLYSDTNCEDHNTDGGVDGYCTLYGPEVWSEPFDATLGQSVSFDWRATGASDDYEIYAFLVAVDETSPSVFDYGDDDAHTLLAYGRGDSQGWTTASSVVPAAGSYRFRFVNGSYDGSGGLALGSEMFIDSVVKVGLTNPITFPQPGDKIVGAAPFALSPTSPAGPVTLSSTTPDICTVVGNTVTLTGTLGVCTIVADQAGDGVDYVPAASVARSFTVLAEATAPTNYGLPVINGTLGAGQFLSATEGTWGDGGSPITGSTMQWKATTGGDTVDLPGATGTSCYLVASPGTTLSVSVTKTNAIGSTTATSTATLDGYTCGTPPTPTTSVEMMDVGTEPGSAQATASGSGMQPYSTFTVTLQPGGEIIGTGTVGGDGTFSLVVTVPSGLAEGEYSIVVDATRYDGDPAADTGWFSVDGAGVIDEVSTTGPTGGSADGGFVGVGPVRVLDTRTDGGRVDAGSTTEVVVAGEHGIPADSSAVVLNVASVDPAGPGYVTVFPCGSTRPTASNLNFGAGQTIANAASVAVGDGGAICFYSLVETDLVVDVSGAYSAEDGTGRLAGFTPSRLFDSRDAGEQVAAGSVQRIEVAGQGGVDADATSVVLSVTVTEPDAFGYVTAYPCGGDTPLASNVNYAPGQTVANAVTTAVGADGEVCVYSSAETHLVVDVTADYVADDSRGTIDLITIERMLDTRLADGPTSGAKVAGGATQEVQVGGEAGIDADAPAVTLNVTVVDPEAIGFVTVYPCGSDLPLASNINYAPGQTVANSVTTSLGADGTVCVYTLSTAHIVVDADLAMSLPID